MKSRVGECWYMTAEEHSSTDPAIMSAEQFLVIVRSDQGRNYFVHTLISTHQDGKFEFRTMREWSMSPLETLGCKRVG